MSINPNKAHYPMLIDTHCHLDFDCFDPIREQLLTECYEHNIRHFINPAVSFSNWQKVIDLSKQYACITPALGLHPCYVAKHTEQELAALETWLIKYQLNLVGEIGLDKRFLDTFTQQLAIFQEQILIAKALKKPVIIHSVKAHHEVIETLKQHQFIYGGIIHAFSGSYNLAKAYCDMGFKLGVGSILHYPNGKLTKVLPRIGAEHVLLETDSPDMLLPEARESINTPLSLLKTFDLLCYIFEENQNDLELILQKNGRKFTSAMLIN